MNSTIKRKIFSLIRSIILIPSGYIVALMGHNRVVGEGFNTIALVIGVLMICLGVYFAYDFLIGSRKEIADNTVPSSGEVRKDESDTERQLRMLKELYDSGIITEEEFSEKKKQLLDL